MQRRCANTVTRVNKQSFKNIVSDIVNASMVGVYGVNPFEMISREFRDVIGLVADYLTASSVPYFKSHPKKTPCPL